MRVMISMPMNYFNWRSTYADVKNRLEAKGYEVTPLTYKELYGKRPPDLIEELCDDNSYRVYTAPLFSMSTAFARMAISDAVYFCHGWEEARGCRLEHQAAIDYGLKILYEDAIEDENEN